MMTDVIPNFSLDDDGDEEVASGDIADKASSSAATPTALHTNSPPPPVGMMMIGKGGTYHPDFMFCGTCSDCADPDPSQLGLEEEKQAELYLDDESIKSESVVIITKFQLREKLLKPYQAIVVQSLLNPLPGVNKVTVNTVDASITIEHDTATSTESILSALESAGHSAFIQNPTVNPDALLVRSQFYVKGICCTSEVPAVKFIVKPLAGVSKLQINIATKVVNVQHDISVITAQQIAIELSRKGFPTQVRRDGEDMALAKQQTTNNGRTTLHVEGALTPRDASRIEEKLSKMRGLSSIGVNIAESVIFVDHNVNVLTSDMCVEQLKPEFHCTVAIAGERAKRDSSASALDQIGHSKYVESTIWIEGMHSADLEAIEKAVSTTFNLDQVRAFYPNLVSKTVKVEHDPNMASILDVVNTLSNYNVCAEVNVDGADLNLYLPLQEEYPSNQVASEEPSLMKIHSNVWFSGVFWVLSLFSYGEGRDNFKFFGLVSVIFGLPPIVLKAYRTLLRRQFDANCMMVTAAIGALALGEFDEAASVAFLFSISEFLEARATVKARKALGKICNLRPDHANVIHPITKEIIVVPADRVPLGSVISVKSGDKIAADGIIVEGNSSVDESSLTGESKPSHKKQGEKVKGGTINIGSSQLVIKTTTTVDDSAVARLIRLVEEAQSNRSPTEKMIDDFARSYTPTVMFIAILMCSIPWAWGPEVGRYWTLNGLIIVVIACPCALTISTPVTYAAGLAAIAQRGIVVKGGAKLEAMGSVDRVVFDKTGTLTKGKFSVVYLEVIGSTKTRQEMMELLALMQERSSHPLSTTLVEAVKSEGLNIPRHIQMTEHTILKGEGITGKADGRSVYVGNQRLFSRLGMFDVLPFHTKDLVESWSSTGGTVGFIGTGGEGIFGAFCVKDEIREEARSVVEWFRDAHIDTIICTGDSVTAAHAVAKEVGIPRGAVYSQLLPEDKMHLVGSLKRPQPKRLALCRKKRYVLFCGDGVNDAPALAAADIGASMGEGAAVAMEMSDVTLMDSKLNKLSHAIKMGRRVLKIVKENILISLVAKLVVVGLTFLGTMTLLLAITADVGIMLLVTLNGMKLLDSNDFDSTNRKEIPSSEKRRQEMIELTSPLQTDKKISGSMDQEFTLRGNEVV